jgi:hypothetical protein
MSLLLKPSLTTADSWVDWFQNEGSAYRWLLDQVPVPQPPSVSAPDLPMNAPELPANASVPAPAAVELPANVADLSAAVPLLWPHAEPLLQPDAGALGAQSGDAGDAALIMAHAGLLQSAWLA